jgi:hypothetical protein
MNIQTPHLQQDEGPQLTSIAPSIFVPITHDLTAPFDKPASEAERLRRILQNVDTQSAAVKANILNIFDQEIIRTRRDAKEAEKGIWNTSSTEDLGLSKEQFESLARNVEARPEPGQSYRVSDIPRPNFVETEQDRHLSLREWFVKRVMDWVEAAVVQVEGYSAHVEEVRADYEKALRDAEAEEARK